MLFPGRVLHRTRLFFMQGADGDEAASLRSGRDGQPLVGWWDVQMALGLPDCVSLNFIKIG
jgi:hypothetical protein